MKYIIFLLFPIFSFGQIEGSQSFTFDTGQYKPLDTLKVVMHVCDTSFIPNFSSRFEFNDSLVYEIRNRLTMTWWQPGYIVRELHIDTYNEPGVVYVDDWGNIKRDLVREYWVNVGYLGPDKKPLPKSLLIWQYK